MDVTNHSSSPSSSFEQRLHAIKDSLRKLLETSGESASELKHRAIEVEHVAAARTREVAAKAGGWAQAAGARAGTWIKAHPVASVAIAFGVGYAIVRSVRR